MLANLSLRTKLSIYVSAAISVAVLLCISLFALHGVSRIRSESESALRLAMELVIGVMPSIMQSATPEVELRKIIVEANNSRHVRIYSKKISALGMSNPNPEAAPSWFSNIITTRTDKKELSISNKNGFNDKIIIESNPSDEIAEIWAEINWISLASLGIISLTTLIISIVVSKTLAPINEYVLALNKLDKGEREIDIIGNGSPEFRIISERINTLAKTLHNLDYENHKLIQKMIKIQDNERKELSRNLHDDFGPALFMTRIVIGGLRKKIELALGAKNYNKEWEAIDQNIDKLQQINRGVLGRLRPAALEEMGLIDAVEAMAQSWRKTNPHVDLKCKFSVVDYSLDEDRSLTAYRIVQEALTNIYRHSAASKALVQISTEAKTNAKILKIIIEDNGVGINPISIQGIGLRGIQERILSVGGELLISSAYPSGTRIEAILPSAQLA
jgi:two-component system, NarL family, sensor histidine kinase UhpB